MSMSHKLKRLGRQITRRPAGAEETMIDSVPQKPSGMNNPAMTSKPSTEHTPSLSTLSGKSNPFLPIVTPAPIAVPAPQGAVLPQVRVRNFSLRASERLLVLGFIDILLINLALIVALTPVAG